MYSIYTPFIRYIPFISTVQHPGKRLSRQFLAAASESCAVVYLPAVCVCVRARARARAWEGATKRGRVRGGLLGGRWVRAAGPRGGKRRAPRIPIPPPSARRTPTHTAWAADGKRREGGSRRRRRRRGERGGTRGGWGGSHEEGSPHPLPAGRPGPGLGTGGGGEGEAGMRACMYMRA